MIRLEMDADDLARLLGHLDGLADVASRLMEPVQDLAGAALRDAWWENFATEGQGEWPDLADWTQEERQAQGYDPQHPILVRSGDLIESVTNPHHAQHDAHMEWAGEGQIRLVAGSEDVRYNLLHFGGMTALGTYVPPRPMEVVHPHQEDALATALGQAVEGVLGAIESGQ